MIDELVNSGVSFLNAAEVLLYIKHIYSYNHKQLKEIKLYV